MEITLCLIVKDEEEKLSACLRSFDGIFQKLVIVDTGSSDKTKDIAAEFGAEMFNFKWIKDFSKARNFALSKVNTEWVMMVDADDTLESKDKLMNELSRLSSDTLGVFMPYLYSNINGGNGIMAFLPRIWKTNLNIKYILPVHEYLNVPANLLQKFVRINTPIIHHKIHEDFSKSFQRNIEILENAHKKGDKHPRILFYLGHDNFYAGNDDASMKWFKKFLKLPGVHLHEAYKAWMIIAKIHTKSNNIVKAKKAYLKAIEKCPDFLEPHILLGDLAMTAKDFKHAVEYYNEALYCKPPRTHIFINTHLNYKYAEQKILEALKAIEPKKA
jgi:glycosyltransferase involved in cell wall biosynthesis